MSGNVCRLGDQKGARDTPTLSVVVDHEIRWDVRVVVTETRQWREDDAVGKGNVTNLDGLEKRRGRHVDCWMVLRREKMWGGLFLVVTEDEDEEGEDWVDCERQRRAL